MVPEMENAVKVASEADIFIVIGTSLQVYPAAGLLHEIPENCDLFVIDPHLPKQFTQSDKCFQTTAVEGMKKLKEILLHKYS
jgi:NAD-dependent deacetylase